MASIALVVAQALLVAFLWTHDWIPLGRLNDVAAVRAANTRARLVAITLIQSLPFTVLLALSVARWVGVRVPGLTTALWIAYSILLAGELRGWWWPWLVRPNTAHVMLHTCTALVLILLTLGAR